MKFFRAVEKALNSSIWIILRGEFGLHIIQGHRTSFKWILLPSVFFLLLESTGESFSFKNSNYLVNMSVHIMLMKVFRVGLARVFEIRLHYKSRVSN